MRVYLAYKYQNHKNKNELRKALENLSGLVESWGYETFLLARDIKKWQHIHLGFIKHIPTIYTNIKKSDLVLAYVDSKEFSKGLLFEILILNLLRKKSVLLINKNLGDTSLKKFFGKHYYINSLADVNETFIK